jgi:hypothetical protein
MKVRNKDSQSAPTEKENEARTRLVDRAARVVASPRRGHNSRLLCVLVLDRQQLNLKNQRGAGPNLTARAALAIGEFSRNE